MKTALIAFSGGLDTSFLVPFARKHYGAERVITCTVNTGGFGPDELNSIAARSKEMGADEHILIDAEEEYYQRVIKFLIFGNVSRDGYPLCVGAERMIQGEKTLEQGLNKGAEYFLHGSTGAGNDQYRFDLVALVNGRGQIKCCAPVRDLNLSRDEETKFLKDLGINVPQKSSNYSYNVGLWGISIGGTETHVSIGLIPEEAWYSKPDENLIDAQVSVEFVQGEAVSAESPFVKAQDPVSVIKLLSDVGSRFGIGRHYHIGSTIPGKKGRLAYESPAADLLYAAHHTLEKLTLSQAQIFGKASLAVEFGRLIHEARFYDPYMQDIQAFLASTQRRVSGKCSLVLTKGYIKSVVAESPFNLLGLKGSVYGEVASAYTGDDARGACRLHAYEQELYHSINNKISKEN